MVRCFCAELNALPNLDEIRSVLPPSWLAVWRAHHPRTHADGQMRKSLGGLWLLFENGCRGELGYTENGRPYFKDGAFEVSISHTETLVLCAIGDPEDGAIGIDAESLSRVCDSRIESLSERWFTPAEQAFYRSNPTKEAFLHLWTCKEAYVKRTGEGLRALQTADTVALKSAGLQFCSTVLGETYITVCTKKEIETAFYFDKGE